MEVEEEDEFEIYTTKAEIEKRYEVLWKLGEGGFSMVYAAKDKKLCKDVAIKKMKDARGVESHGISKDVLRECASLRELSHPNIIRLLGLFMGKSSIWLILERMDQSLGDYIPYKVMNRRHRIDIMRQIALGLAFCHSRGVMHRDIKPQNILVSKKAPFTVKLADFGHGRKFNVPLRAYSQTVCTMWYNSPELLLGMKMYNTSHDVWSYACVMFFVYEGYHLFTGDSEISMQWQIFAVLGTPTRETFQMAFECGKDSIRWPSYAPKNLSLVIPHADPDELDLFTNILRYEDRLPMKKIASTLCAFEDIPIKKGL